MSMRSVSNSMAGMSISLRAVDGMSVIHSVLLIGPVVDRLSSKYIFFDFIYEFKVSSHLVS